MKNLLPVLAGLASVFVIVLSARAVDGNTGSQRSIPASIVAQKVTRT
jgi:hypothetical protein